MRVAAAGCLGAGALALALLGGPGTPAGADVGAAAPPIGSGDGGVVAQIVEDGFAGPIYVTTAPGAPNLVYVVERGGTVQVLDGGVVQPAAFLDISSLVSTAGEGGLLSIAFDPGFAANGLVYAYYVNTGGDIEIDEFETLSPTDADEGSRRQVIVVPHPNFQNHYGGTIQFGPDDLLYAATGDGGGGGDPNENAQSKLSLLGKLLRIDPHGALPGQYGIPATNPYVGVGKGGLDEIYALGLRNPFRFSFDSLSGRITIGDVGQDLWEEVDYERAADLRGANFGWDYFEGTQEFECEGGCPPNRYQPPIHQYPNPASGAAAITGGVVVRDETLPTLYGRYLYADFYGGALRSLIPRLAGAQDDGPLGVGVTNPSSFGEGPSGEIYITALTTGRLLRLVPAP